MIRRLTRQYVEFLAGNGVTNFLAGGAVGYDLMCALIVLSLKEKFHDIRLEIVLPSPDYDRFFPEQVRLLYSKIFQKADDIVFISKIYSKKNNFLRNIYMVDRSSYLVCYCTRQEGGSYFTRTYAERKKLTIYNVRPGCYDCKSL